MTPHPSASRQPDPQKRRWLGTTRGLLVVVASAAIACFTLVQLRGCRFGRSSMHGPRYLWHLHLSSIEYRKFFEDLAVEAEEKAPLEKRMAAKAPNLTERKEHEARAESWTEKASFYRSEAVSTVRSAKMHLKHYQESLREHGMSQRSP